MSQSLSLFQLFELFPDERSAEKWLEYQLWGKSIQCARCSCSKSISIRKNRNPMPYWCGACKKYFNIRTNTLMEYSRLPLRKWIIAMYLFQTNPKGISSIQMQKDLGITQKSAWFLLQRLREAFDKKIELFSGEVEVDETYMGGLRKNMPLKKRRETQSTAGRGVAGKFPIIGMKCRKTKKVVAKAIDTTDCETLHEFVHSNTTERAIIDADEHRGYRHINREHYCILHRRHQYVNGEEHTNGIESFWLGIKRAYKGTYHYMSQKHLNRYVKEFTGRFNLKGLDVIEQMKLLFQNMVGKQLMYRELIT